MSSWVDVVLIVVAAIVSPRSEGAHFSVAASEPLVCVPPPGACGGSCSGQALGATFEKLSSTTSQVTVSVTGGETSGLTVSNVANADHGSVSATNG